MSPRLEYEEFVPLLNNAALVVEASAVARDAFNRGSIAVRKIG